MDLFRRRTKRRKGNESTPGVRVRDSISHIPTALPGPVGVRDANPVAFPQPPVSPDEVLRTAGEYARVHEELDRTVVAQLPLTTASSATVILHSLRVPNPTTFDTTHDLFRPMISISALAPTTFRAWVVNLVSNETQAPALVVDIQNATMPKALLVFRLDDGRYMACYCDPSVIQGWELPDESAVAQPSTPEPGHVRQLIKALAYSEFGRADALEELWSLGEAVADDLIQALKSDPDPEIRQNVPDAMEKLPPGRAVPALIDALNDPDHIVRHSASDALRKLGDEGAVPAIRDALHRETDDYARSMHEYALLELTETEEPTAPQPPTLKSADEVVARAFELLRTMETLGSEVDARRIYKNRADSWSPAALYEGTESEIRNVFGKVLTRWAKRPDFGHFQVEIETRWPGCLTAYAFMVNNSGETVSFFPACVWRTPDRYFAYGNSLFRLEETP